jgi:uncharacterized protein
VNAGRVFDALLRFRSGVLLGLVLAVLVGIWATRALPVDMSFRPTFSGDAREAARTREHERIFGQVGLRDLVALIDVKDAADPKALAQVARLAARLRRLPNVSDVRDPLSFPFFDGSGALRPNGVTGSLTLGESLDSAFGRSQITDLLRSPAARRVVVGDGNRRVAVSASLDIPNEAFARRRAAVLAFRSAVTAWSTESGYATQITGYPEVEQVYAREVLLSVFRSIGTLFVIMVGILFLYFRRWSDVLTCLLGVTLSLPLVLGVMAALGQPFSIVNSQVLTLVLIVGIGQALHHQEEYRRRREAGRAHRAANREAFAILAWPSFMTGFATLTGFAALLSADMRAISSFGLCTALGVAIVYGVNWLVVPLSIERFYRSASAQSFASERKTWTLSLIRAASALLQRHPGWIAVCFALATVLLATFGLPSLSIDQRVNEELPAEHPAVRAERTYEREFTGFLGPELSIRAAPGGTLDEALLTAFVNQLCDLPEVRYVASALDFAPQPQIAQAGGGGKACRRVTGSWDAALAARAGAAGPSLARFATPVVSGDRTRTAVVIRVADIGTAHSLPFVERVRAAANNSLPHATVEPVGQWWLAQQGMNRLSFDVMFSAITALLVILPIMWFAIRDFKLFLAAIPPTILPVFATLGVMGLLHITVRIGTAMILAIALGLAADDTIHLSVRIRERLRAGSDPDSALSATLLRTGRPCSFSSYVLIGGFASMLTSSLLALQAMGLVAMFSMSFALACDLILGPALFLLLARPAPSPLAEVPTLRELLVDTVTKHPERPAVSYRNGKDHQFHTLTWHELGNAVLDAIDELESALPNQPVIAVLSDTNARYPLLELAVGLTGRTLQPLYVSASDDELRVALVQSGARVLVAGPEQLVRATIASLCPSIVELNRLLPLEAALLPHSEPFDTESLRERLLALPPRAACTPLLYLQSTGTTGPARLIVVSEAAVLRAAHSAARESSHAFPRFLSFLPTAHISERLLTSYVSLRLAGHTYYGDGVRTLTEDLRASLPSALLTPPLLLQTLREQATTRARTTALGRSLLGSVQRASDALLASGVVGAVPRGLSARVFGARLRRSAGLHRVRDFLAGAAPVPAALQAWCEAAGLPLRIVYGQTELTGATSISPRKGASLGAVGVPVAGVALRLAHDGELLVQSGTRFSGYLGDELATLATLQGDWLHTGDRARFLATGELVLLGRVQAVMRTGGGASVNTTDIVAALRESFGPAEYVFAQMATGAYLYVALPSSSPAELEPLAEHDARWGQFAPLLAQTDPQRLVSGVALFLGNFREAYGEVGPTGKPRAHRIHALHESQICLTAQFSKQKETHDSRHHSVELGGDLRLCRVLE